MSCWNRHQWFTSRPRTARRLFGSARQTTHLRSLRFEPLEDRRLLSITVNTLVDENDGIALGGISLRDAIAAAATNESINFTPSLFAAGPATLSLTHGELFIDKPLSITGPGASLLMIDASSSDATPGEKDGMGSRVFDVDNLDNNIVNNVSLRGLTLTGADVSDGGGAIFNLERLTVSDCILRGNAARLGGGIYNAPDGVLMVENSTITGNVSPDGAGIWNADYGYLAIDSTFINANVSANAGGGIGNDNGFVNISGSTISGNSAGSDGGGIYTRAGGTLTISASTISGNSAGGIGGGIDDQVTLLSITSSTIDHNYAGGTGGGLYLITGFLGVENNTITNSTISGNSAGVTFGGIGVQPFANDTLEIANSTITGNITNTNPLIPNPAYNGGGIGVHVSSFGTVELSNTIVAGNTWHGSARDDVSGAIGARYSLIGDDTGATITNNGGNQIGTGAVPINPLLGPLADNSGPTKTHALLQGSPAIDAGDPAAVAGVDVPQFDQRGAPFERIRDGNAIFGAVIDIGAFEVQSVMGPVLLGDYNLNHVVDAADYTVWRDNLGTNVAPYSGADGNGNGIVDSQDYTVWKSHFGMTFPGSGAGSSTAATPLALVTSSSMATVAEKDSLASDASDVSLDLPNVNFERPLSLAAERTTLAESRTGDGLLAWFSSLDSRRREQVGDQESDRGNKGDVLDSAASDTESIDCAFEVLGRQSVRAAIRGG